MKALQRCTRCGGTCRRVLVAACVPEASVTTRRAGQAAAPATAWPFGLWAVLLSLHSVPSESHLADGAVAGLGHVYRQLAKGFAALQALFQRQSVSMRLFDLPFLQLRLLLKHLHNTK